MGLTFDNAWRYESPGEIPRQVSSEFFEIISKIARGEQKILEHFKSHFAPAAGMTSAWSSSASWASSDLSNYMDYAATNAPLFIEAFYDACESLRVNENLPAPDVVFINKILAKHEAKYQINPPNLDALGAVHISPAPEIPQSLDQQAQKLIQDSIANGQRLLAEG